jgi:Holliday junction resolvase
MSGNYSRNKGRRREYELRDFLRNLGWDAVRVPLSGASEGYKGDIAAKKEGVTKVFELKARKSDFTTIYDLLARKGVSGIIAVSCVDLPGSPCVTISEELKALATRTDNFFMSVGDKHPEARTVKKIFKMRELLGGADYLVIKDDRRPFLFLEYK